MKELLNKIKKKGYWKVEIRPTLFIENRIPSFDESVRIITNSQVSLRGWNYPHIDSSGIKKSGNDSIESFCDSDNLRFFEYWRFYQSAQFVHYFSMREDYRLSDEKIKEIQEWHGSKSTKFLSIISTLYSITEIYVFVMRMASKDILDDEIIINIELADVEGRELFFWENYDRYLSRAYICGFRNENIVINKIVKREVLISEFSDMALEVTLEIFKNFNWTDINKQIFLEDQRKFLERRLS